MMTGLTYENLIAVKNQLFENSSKPIPDYNYVFPPRLIEAGQKAGLIIQKDNRLWYTGQGGTFEDNEYIPGAPPGWVHASKPIPQ